jgi:uncharacterized OsmC-like protein
MTDTAEHGFKVKLTLLENYLFQIDFGDFGNIMSDEAPPLGDGEGPNPMRLLAASIANCLAASLVFAVRKFKEDPGQVSAEVSGKLERIDGRWRVQKMAVELHLDNSSENLPHLERVLAQFEDFCIVTQSVREGIEVDVSVFDAQGVCVKPKVSV